MTDVENLICRTGASEDLARLVDIYNHYVTETQYTFDMVPFKIGERIPWFTQFAAEGPHRLIVAQAGDDVVGYASSSEFRKKPAYEQSVETTIYLHPEWTDHGVGMRLYAELLGILQQEPMVHRAYAGIALPNPESIALHEKLGFVPIGTYHEVGFKFDRYWDVRWFEKELSGG